MGGGLQITQLRVFVTTLVTVLYQHLHAGILLETAE